jgi:hypothetical protein
MSKPAKNPEKSFGVSVGGVLLFIAALLVWRHRISRAEVVGGIGAVLLMLGVVSPRLLRWPSALWWRFSRALGYVNARILLTVLFSLILVPLSYIWRLMGVDPLARKRRQFSGWTPYPARYADRKHFERLF